MFFDNSGIGENFQVPTDPRLALGEDARQFRHRQFALYEKRNNAQARFLTDGAKHIEGQIE